MTLAHRIPYAALLCVFCCLTLLGCEEAVEPFTNTDRHFSVFGFLDPASDVQYLRVTPIRQLVDPPPPGPIDAQVTVTELETGRTIAWEDSVIIFEDGTAGHVFRGRFRPLHSYTYRLEVRRSDGITTSAETHVPAFLQATVNPPSTSTLGNGVVRVRQEVAWQGIDFRPFRVQVWYRFSGTQPGSAFRDVPVTYSADNLGRFDSDVWRVNVDLTEDQNFLREEFGVPGNEAFPFTLYGVGMQVTVPDAQWRPPGGVFDPEILIQPGTLSNVQNGFGFFGSVAQLNTEWTLSQETARLLGYPYPRQPAE